MDVLNKVPVREQEAAVRAKNFEEVCLGYNMERAKNLLGFEKMMQLMATA